MYKLDSLNSHRRQTTWLSLDVMVLKVDFSVHKWSLLSLEKIKLNRNLSRGFLYVMVGWINVSLYNCYDKIIKLFHLFLIYSLYCGHTPVLGNIGRNVLCIRAYVHLVLYWSKIKIFLFKPHKVDNKEETNCRPYGNKK